MSGFEAYSNKKQQQQRICTKKKKKTQTNLKSKLFLKNSNEFNGSIDRSKLKNKNDIVIARSLVKNQHSLKNKKLHFFKHTKSKSKEILKSCLNLKETQVISDFRPQKISKELLQWMIYPLSLDRFIEKNWERFPVHIKRNKPKYFRSLISTQLLDTILREHSILYSKNIDITSFTNDTRETHNPAGRALPSVVWDYFSNGCSVRMLNPQTYIPKLHALNAILQEFFGCFVGANSYLTPPNSQGFAPHYDDIEAFILQIEGKKRWRLYKPKKDADFLPRYSSPNFSQNELGEPILDTIVHAGDLLYFPRGTIHQGDTINFKEHSLHLTISVYQNNTWCDFLEKLLPEALKVAAEKDSRFRKGLPINYLTHLGSTYFRREDFIRKKFLNQTKSLLSIMLTNYIDIDKAADLMAKKHIHDFLPPVLNRNESLCSVYNGSERMLNNGKIINRVEIEPDTLIRLTRTHCARLIEENGSFLLYYSTENSKVYHEYEPQYLVVDLEFVPAIQTIIIKYPYFIKVDDLPIQEIDKKIQIVQDLWEKGIVISQRPLSIIED